MYICKTKNDKIEKSMFSVLKQYTITSLKWLLSTISSFPKSYPKQEWYEAAYSSNYLDVWRGTPFDGKDAIREFCYYRAMTCYMSNNRSDYADRRAGLYTYISNEFSSKNKDGTENPNALITKYNPTLPIDTQLPMIMRRITRLYDNPPLRNFVDGDKNNEYKKIYNRLQFDAVMKTSYQLVKMVGQIAMRPVYSNDRYYLVVKTPDSYGVVYDEYDNTIVKEFWELTVYQGKEMFRVWTDEHIKLVKANVKQFDGIGKIANVLAEFKKDKNPYGRIPFEILHLHGGRLDLLEVQTFANKQKLQAGLNQAYNSNPIGVSTNIDKDSLTVAPGTLIAMVDVSIEMERPSIDFYKPDESFLQINEYRESLLYEAQRNEDIPNSVITGDVVAESGLAKLVALEGLIERAKEDEPIMKEYEARLALLVQLISNIDANAKLPDIDFSITYPPETIKLDPQTEYDMATKKFDDGTIDPIEYYKQYGGVSPTLNDDEVISIINDRIKTKDSIIEQKTIVEE